MVSHLLPPCLEWKNNCNSQINIPRSTTIIPDFLLKHLCCECPVYRLEILVEDGVSGGRALLPHPQVGPDQVEAGGHKEHNAKLSLDGSKLEEQPKQELKKGGSHLKKKRKL